MVVVAYSDVTASGPRDTAGQGPTQTVQVYVFRYPMRFLIYTESVDSLPLCVKERLYQRFVESRRRPNLILPKI